MRRFLRDAWLHFFHGTLCVLARRHRDVGQIGTLRKKGFREVPVYQCHKCYVIIVVDADAKKLGGKLS